MCHMTLVSLKHAILGFIDLEPATGYTLAQRFDGSTASFWSATQSQIYRELHDLERAGLVECEVIPQPGKPSRKLYKLTRAGSLELSSWLAAPVEPLQLRDPFLLKFVFAAQLEAAELDAALAAPRAKSCSTSARNTKHVWPCRRSLRSHARHAKRCCGALHRKWSGVRLKPSCAGRRAHAQP